MTDKQPWPQVWCQPEDGIEVWPKFDILKYHLDTKTMTTMTIPNRLYGVRINERGEAI